MSGEGVDAGGTRQPVSHGPQAAAGVCRLHAGERPLRGGTRRPSLSQAPSRPAADLGDSQVTSLTRPNPLQRVAENRYDVMDYVQAGQSPAEIQEWLKLTDQQIGEVMAYIEQHRME